MNGRDLFISCAGSGSPTIVIEAGEGQTSDEMRTVKTNIAKDNLVCSYDRANHGQSGTARTPRTADDIVTDLHGLLAAAQIPAPYVLIGHSAGGMFVQLFARKYEPDTAGVMIMNAVPPCAEWMAQALPAMTETARDDERAYYAGANDEPVDYCKSSEQIDALSPPDVPLETLISTIAQCATTTDICARTYPAYIDVMRTLTESWPQGHFSQVESIHSIYVEHPDAVLETLDTLLTRIANQ